MSNEHIHTFYKFTIRTVSCTPKIIIEQTTLTWERKNNAGDHYWGDKDATDTYSFQSGSINWGDCMLHTRDTESHSTALAHLSEIAIPQLKDHFVWDLCTSGIQLYSCLNCSTANGAGAEKWPAIATCLVQVQTYRHW